MTVIHFTEPKRYQFASQMLERVESIDETITRKPTQYELSTENETLVHLLERINDGTKAIVVPNLRTSRFLITAPDRRQLELACQRIRHFLVPTYAIFEQELRPSKFEGTHPLQTLGAELYPVGYYLLKSRKEFEHQVLNCIGLWMELEERYPQIEPHSEILTYGRLYEQFKMALATARWKEAEQVRSTMLHYNLASAENLLFLEIEQLALQQRWKEIWDHPDRPQIVQARVPRNVRGAMLSAFHQMTLFQLEQQGKWKEALEEFRANTPTLGTLLTSRLGLIEGPVIEVFAYQAVLEKDRETLLDLMNISTIAEVQLCIKSLLSLLAPESASAPLERVTTKPTPLSLVRNALDLGNFDEARHYAEEVEESKVKTVLLMQISYHTLDIPLAEQSLLSYNTFTKSEQKRLLERFPFIQHVLGALQKLTTETEGQKEASTEQKPEAIQDWLVWFSHIKIHTFSNVEMSQAIPRLAESCDERFWTDTHIEQFTEYLITLIDDPVLIKKDLIRDALLKIAQFFLLDQEFPKTEVLIYRDLYETLFMAFLSMPKELQYTGWLLLRLADAQLCHTQEKCETIFRSLEEWCGAPIPRLEPWALDTFEMLLNYGLEPTVLVNWYQLWISELMRLQPRTQVANLNGWLELGRCIPLGGDLLDRLQERLNEHQPATDDPIKLLPNGYKIGIYSLLEPAAQRAKELLLVRNPSLEIRICTDKVMTEMAKTIAQQSNVVVMVITALKHAVSNGIVPLIDPAYVVRPQSSGTTSLIRAVEEYATKYYL